MSNDVFPAPEGPMMLTDSPFFIAKEILFNMLILLDLVSRVKDNFLISTAFMKYLSKILFFAILAYSHAAFCSTQIV
ncbi:MAG: hypothetical protein ACHP6I_03990, partial [Rickettsiales bacterium]